MKNTSNFSTEGIRSKRRFSSFQVVKETIDILSNSKKAVL